MSALDKIFESCENLGNTLVQNGSVFLSSNNLDSCRTLTEKDNTVRELSTFEKQIMGKNRQSTKDAYLEKRQLFMKEYQDYNTNVNNLVNRLKKEEIDREAFNREYKVLQERYLSIVRKMKQFMKDLYEETNNHHSKSEENQYKSLMNLMYKKNKLEDNGDTINQVSTTVETRFRHQQTELEKIKKKYKIILFIFLFLTVFNCILILRGFIF